MHIEDGVIVKADSPVITTQCIRVPVLDGHTAAVFMDFEEGNNSSGCLLPLNALG